MLFPTRVYRGGAGLGLGRQYDVAPDGRFLINTALEGAAAPQSLVVVQDWMDEVKRLVPTK